MEPGNAQLTDTAIPVSASITSPSPDQPLDETRTGESVPASDMVFDAHWITHMFASRGPSLPSGIARGLRDLAVEARAINREAVRHRAYRRTGV